MFEFLFKYSATVLKNGLYSAKNLPHFAVAIGLIVARSLLLILMA